MLSATAHIVVQATPQEKRAIVTRARRIGMSVSELMCAGAASFEPAPRYLIELARAAQESVDRSSTLVHASMTEIAKSNARIKTLEAKADRSGASRRQDIRRQATAAKG